MESPILMTVLDAAHVLSVSRSRIYTLIISGELESVKIGKSRRVTREALDRFVEYLVTTGDGVKSTPAE